MRFAALPAPGHPGRFALSDSEKAESLTTLETQVQPVTDLSVPACTKTGDEAQTTER